jgi:hypothetical protein
MPHNWRERSQGAEIVVQVVFGVAPTFSFENKGIGRRPHEPEGSGAANFGKPHFGVRARVIPWKRAILRQPAWVIVPARVADEPQG